MEDDRTGYPIGYPVVHEQATTREFLLNLFPLNNNVFGDKYWASKERSLWSEPLDNDRRRYDSDEGWLSKVRGEEEVDMVESEARSLPFHYCSSDLERGYGYEDNSQFEGVLEWIFIPTNLILETLSGFFDQLSSPRRPHYALIAMLMSIFAVLFCILEFVHKSRRKQEIDMRKSRFCGRFYNGSFVDNFGILCSVVQCVFSIIQFVYICEHANYPIKLCIFPIIFGLAVTFSHFKSKYCGRFRDCRRDRRLYAFDE